ncbi:hypothetical protein WDU94_011200 [Cyamophila willieti]
MQCALFHRCPGAPITPIITRPKTRKLDTLVSYSTSLDDISSVSKESSAVPSGDVTWSPLDLYKAARVITRDTHVSFETREEMKRVYALLGDVLRFKSVLQKALEEVDFYIANPQFTDMHHLVWLFTYDMYKLNFKPRIERNSPKVEFWYADHGFDLLIRQVWRNRIQIAAAVARIRIRNTALRLKTLLPSHLQEYKFMERCTEKVALNGWVNFAKTTIAEVESLLTEMGYYPRGQLKPSEYDVPLDCFMGDHVLPGFIHVLPSDVKEFLSSRLIVTNMLVIQDRSYCFGPALLCKFMLDEKLTGSVIMSHFDIPSTVGYMASLLTNVNHEPEDKLRVYGVGSRREEHLLTYTTSMGFNNVELYSEEFTTVRPGSKYLENVVAVLATPPNTNTAVKDPIELVVAKGGDLDLLLNLLSDDFENEVVGKYIHGHMEVQRKTLRLAMSRPQDNMARIMAPTVASLRHTVQVSHPALVPCPREHYHSAGIPVLGGYRLQPRPSNEPRRWWHSVFKSVVEKIRRPAGRMRPLRLFRSRRIRRLSPVPVAVRTIEYSEAGTWDSLSYVGKSRTI